MGEGLQRLSQRTRQEDTMFDACSGGSLRHRLVVRQSNGVGAAQTLGPVFQVVAPSALTKKLLLPRRKVGIHKRIGGTLRLTALELFVRLSQLDDHQPCRSRIGRQMVYEE